MNVNWLGPINHLGYGVASYNILMQLDKITDVALYPLGGIPSDLLGDVDDLLLRGDSLNYPCIKMTPLDNLYEFVGKGKHIGFPIFESNLLTDAQIKAIRHCDEVFTCSEWAKSVINKSVHANVHVIPLGVDSGVFRNMHYPHRGTTTFLHCGKWEKRKGQDFLVNCFSKAFDENDNVELWLICENEFVNNDEWKKFVKFSKLSSKIKILPRQKTQHDLAVIMNEADCGIFPSRAEGWNLELLEMMSCGKHVIATNYSGHTEYCNHDNCLLIEVDEVEKSYNTFPSVVHDSWAKLGESQEEQLIDYMRTVHTSKARHNLRGEQTAMKYSWKNTAKLIVKTLGEM